MPRRRATVATPGEWQCKTARSGEWAQHFSNASCFFSGRPRSNEFSEITGRIFTNISGIGRELDKFCIHLAIAHGTLPWQPTKVGKSEFFAEKNSFVALPIRNRLEYRNAYGQLTSALNVATSFTTLVRFGAVTLEKCMLIFCTFVKKNGNNGHIRPIISA